MRFECLMGQAVGVENMRPMVMVVLSGVTRAVVENTLKRTINRSMQEASGPSEPKNHVLYVSCALLRFLSRGRARGADIDQRHGRHNPNSWLGMP